MNQPPRDSVRFSACNQEPDAMPCRLMNNPAAHASRLTAFGGVYRSGRPNDQ
ncbi:hypothetical protein Pla52n_13990 [Stieleria varia]|uniref:Uncharacterized protein n=1 Tax=Stieleria varia TaxID=2528005 RepID=A0A5C6B5D2_9BACT|nr:hypothetical protein Pla52n_13990 [Stieleria varia]